MAFSVLEKDIEKSEPNRESINSTESCPSESNDSSTEIPATSTISDENGQKNHLTPKASCTKDDIIHKTKSGASAATTGTQDPAFEVDWDGPDDPDNPLNWSLGYKSMVIAVLSYSTTVVVLYSTSYTAAIPGIQNSFGISETVGILGVTTYLLGLAVGCLISAPMSEMVGRRPIYIISIAFFTLLVLPTALAQTYAGILAPRFFGAIAAASLISNAPGSINDIAKDEYRALVFSIWGIGPMNGPVLGPLIGGWVFQYAGWRWVNWVVMIAAGVAFGFLIFAKETYAPTILRKKAHVRRTETGDERWWSRYDEKKSVLELLKINLR